MINKIKRNHFYVHSPSVWHASPAHVENERNKIVYFILSSEINAYQKQQKMISITSEIIWITSDFSIRLILFHCSLYFHCSFFGLPLTFPFA